MCEIDLFIITTVVAGIVGAIIAIGIAIGLNSGFFSAPAAPAAMMVAGLASTAAVTGLILLDSEITDYIQCMNATQNCVVDLSAVLFIVKSLAVVLGLQATACFVTFFIAWIPWVGSAPMYTILATLLSQVALITTLYILIEDLISCANSVAAAPVDGVMTGSVIIVLVAIGFTAYVRRNSPWRWKTKIDKKE